MTFGREQNVTIVGIEDISISLFVPGPNNANGVQSGKIEIQLALSNGKIRVVEADLLARLQDDAAGQTHLASLVALRNYIRGRLTNEVLPL